MSDVTTQDETRAARPTTRTTHHRVVIVGGGSAGITVAARLCRELDEPDVAVIEPSQHHYYQPLWTLVGGGEATRESSVRSMASVMPAKARWLVDSVAALDPDRSRLRTAEGVEVSYDFLVLAPGIKLDWDRVKGLTEAIGKDGVCSNYSFETVGSTWDAIRAFKGGNAVFTHPNTPIKCGGAPQKIMYLAADYFRRHGLGDRAHVTFGIASPKIFAVERYAETLLRVCERYGIDVRYRHDLVEVRAAQREAVFRRLDSGDDVVIPYDLLHVTPPMSAPDFVKTSALADAAGWIEVDRGTLQHPRFANVFALGDASNLPTSKTGAAIRKQAPVLVSNLRAQMSGEEFTSTYDGYTSCPLVTGYGKLVLAEFDYELEPAESFPIDQSVERRSMYAFKKHLLPRIYWHGMLKGRL